MSDGRLYLDPPVVRTGAHQLAAAGQDYQALLGGAGHELAEASQRRPWGRDDIGQSFENNYRTIEQQVFQAWRQVSEYVQGLGEAAEASVADNQGADHESGTRVARTYRDRP
ncbi:hypothetical protein [Jidongwangia harbinensis]|uniref:hypothetical protein n=1 Tax=Jidongwangia harbinensis TaxID=2878561 RepID=UPI001CD94FDB|nr:hypothetical protein [Jidongwangia harbinensis]MCA2212699.1 hypothetical protein [Jidongwangia harbinensis]